MTRLHMRLKLNHPSRLRWSLLAGAAMLAPAMTNIASAQDGVLVIDSRGASIRADRAPALFSTADGFAAGYDNGAVVVDLSVLDDGQTGIQPLRLRPPPTRRAPAAMPEYALRTNQFAATPPQLYPPTTSSRQLGMRLPPRRPASLTERVQLAVAPPQPAYQPWPQMVPPAVAARPRSFSPSSFVRAPDASIVASQPPPKARVQSRQVAERAPLIRRRKPTSTLPPTAPAPLPLSIALAPTLPERQPVPRPSPAAPPPKQAPLVRLAPARPGLLPAASNHTPAAPPLPRPALNLPKSLPAPPPVASVPAAPRPLLPPPISSSPALIKFAPIRDIPAPPPAYKAVPASGQAAAVLALPPVLLIRNASTAPPPPALTEHPNMVAPQLPSAEQPIRRLPAFSSEPPPVLPPAPQPLASTPRISVPLPPPPPTSRVALPPPPLRIEPEVVTHPMVREDNPELVSLPPALRLEQSRTVTAMAQPRGPASSPRESLSLPVPQSRSTTSPMQLSSTEEVLGVDATFGIEASDVQKAHFPIIFDRQNPPAMAQPGWTPAAPAATIAAAKPVNLASLASLAPPRQPEEPRRLLAALPIAAAAARTVQLPTLTSQPLPNLIQQPVAEPRSFNVVAKPNQFQRQFVPNLEQSRSFQPRADQSRIVRPRMAPPRLPLQKAPELASPSPLPPASLIQPPQRRAFVPGATLPQPIESRAVEPDLGNVTQPGSAVLAPPPPPARAPEIAGRPESQSALPVPATEVSNQAPRRGLSIPDGLARVTAPQQLGGDAPRRLLTLPPIDDLSKAPGFAPLPLPAPIAPPFAGAPTQEVNAVRPQRLSELAPPSQRTAFVPPAGGSQDFSTDIAFAGSSRSLPGDAMPALSAIADRMKSNPGLQARVSGAAAAGDPSEALDVALARALTVRRFLLSCGVMSDAIKVQPVTGGQNRDSVSITLVVPA